MEIAFRLRDLLDQRRLTQSKVAELAGLPNETVNRIVKGTTTNPGIDTLAKIADALNVPVGWILGEKGFEFSTDDRAELRRIILWCEGILRATQVEKTELQPSNVSAVTLGRKPPVRP